MQEFASRTSEEEVQLFVTVFSMAKRSGGDMIQIIRNAVGQISEKIDVKREIETMMAAKQFEFKIMSVVPFAMICYMKISFPAFMEVLYGNILGVIIMSVYVTHVMAFPEVKTEKEKWLDAISDVIEKKEKETREDPSFTLPDSVDGKTIVWSKKKESTGYYILVLGIVAACLVPAKKLQDTRDRKKKRQEQMMRDYPDIISKFTLLLGTGMTLKGAWVKIVEVYEVEKKESGIREAYEEMKLTYREMQGGISEKEAYERFGHRCELVPYMKFGAMLSQNLKKGSKGLGELLKMESIQALENRKSMARKRGEEASTKLLLPMFGMLAVVLIMVIVPAFLSIQL